MSIESGMKKITWAKRSMGVLNELYSEYKERQPLKGMQIALSVHMEAKTAYLCMLLKALGAQVRATGCNPLSTQDDIVAALGKQGVDVKASHACTSEEYDSYIDWTIDGAPDLLIDDGGDIVHALLTRKREHLAKVKGGLEETTTGIHRLKNLYASNRLPFAMMNVNDASLKHMFDNVYGTGQSAWTAIMRATNMTIASKTVVVCGYGHCGKGLVHIAKGLNARVIVTEVDEIAALSAAFDGFEVMPSLKAAEQGDIFVCATGTNKVLTKEHFERMKNGAVLSNAGHFDVEVDMDYLNAHAPFEEVRENVRQYHLNGKELNVLGEGRLVNLAAGDGHPIEIMDMSFSLQLLGAIYLARHEKLEAKLWDIPEEVERHAARLKLKSMGIMIEMRTAEQAMYLKGE